MSSRKLQQYLLILKKALPLKQRETYDIHVIIKSDSWITDFEQSENPAVV